MSRKLTYYEDPSIERVAMSEAARLWGYIEHEYRKFGADFYHVRTTILAENIHKIDKMYGKEVGRRVTTAILTRPLSSCSDYVWRAISMSTVRYTIIRRGKRNKQGRRVLSWIQRISYKLTGFPFS